MTYTGRCACGAVTATIAADAPLAVRQCWCRQCRQIAGGSPTVNAIFATDAITLTGQLARNSYTAASGNTVTHGFCAQCGTAVSAQSSARPEAQAVRLGFIDEPHDLAPQVAIWTSEAPAWAVIDPKLKQYPAQPVPRS